MAPQNLITIDLAPLAGNRIKITLEPNATVSRIKQLFFEKEGIPPECLKLNFQNHELEDHECLDVLGVVDKSTIHFRLFLQAHFFQVQPSYQSTSQFMVPQQ